MDRRLRKRSTGGGVAAGIFAEQCAIVSHDIDMLTAACVVLEFSRTLSCRLRGKGDVVIDLHGLTAAQAELVSGCFALISEH